MRVCLFEDFGAADLAPISLTRPVFDLLSGTSTLAKKHERYFGPCHAAALIRPHLVSMVRMRRPGVAVNDASWLRLGPVVLVNGRWLPPADGHVSFDGPCVATIGDQVAYALLTPDLLAKLTPVNVDECLEGCLDALPRMDAPGHMIRYPWELIDHNADQLASDYRARGAQPNAGWRPANCSVVGPENQLLIDPTAEVDPQVVIDTRNGPVVIDRGAFIGAFTRLEGPCYIGAGTHIVGAKIRAGTTIGPCCRIGGEVECSIIHGFTNKYHDGFLGHSYVGEWVNIGAGAQTSDLRCDYGPVTVPINGRRIVTGRTKVGSLMGDHSKLGIGALLNTGSVVGVFSGMYPAGRLLPRHVPSFCAVYHGAVAEGPVFDEMMTVGDRMMRRRGAEMTEIHRQLYRSVYEMTAGDRRQTIADGEARRHRRVA
jgi:UDP-N-acetylglucosamine diphosphorylase/glucosamine-1-phosphate N-acetyltransferase